MIRPRYHSNCGKSRHFRFLQTLCLDAAITGGIYSVSLRMSFSGARAEKSLHSMLCFRQDDMGAAVSSLRLGSDTAKRRSPDLHPTPVLCASACSADSSSQPLYEITWIIALRFVYVKYFLYVYSLIMPIQAAKLYHAVCFMRQSDEGRWCSAPRSGQSQRDSSKTGVSRKPVLRRGVARE